MDKKQPIDDIINLMLSDPGLSEQNKQYVVQLANHISNLQELKRLKRLELDQCIVKAETAEMNAGDAALLEMLEQVRKANK